MGEHRYLHLNTGQVLSPARQAKKSMRLSGRQWKKYRKAQARQGMNAPRLNRFGNLVVNLEETP